MEGGIGLASIEDEIDLLPPPPLVCRAGPAPIRKQAGAIKRVGNGGGGAADPSNRRDESWGES